jgi:hypothetical protein
MTWTIRKPRFEVKYLDEYGWWWGLVNDGEVVASSHVEKMSKEDALDFVRWVKEHLSDVPIIGDGILEL